jgi:16S rRNA (uracil1498-N3)-methyltransferase
MNRCFLTPQTQVNEQTLILDPKETHHLVKVRRIRIGEAVEVLNGKGTLWECVYRGNANGTLEVIHKTEKPKSPFELNLAIGLPKGNAMESIVQKATEIGVSSIQPLYSEQSDIRLDAEREAKKCLKWEAIAIESLKQCGNRFLPLIHKPILFDRFLDQTMEFTGPKWVAALHSTARPIAGMMQEHPTLDRLFCLVGPEGDFSNREYGACFANGWIPASLGENVLRSDTACTVLSGMLNQWYAHA